MNEPGCTFRRLVPACAERGIGRTVAFSLAKSGLLETFKLGRATFVYVESLNRLPVKLAERERAKVAA
ncbi:MAG: excisionase [Proteobacteria bacterium]|nr:excisionase [Pseudomonadota bacterium]